MEEKQEMDYELSPEVLISKLDMASQVVESRRVWFSEILSLDEIEKAIKNYIKFKNAKRGRKPKYHVDLLSEWMLDYDLKQGDISITTYRKYKKLIQDQESKEVK